MDRHRQQRHQLRASIIKAMAHPSRLCVIEALERGESCVQDLRDLIGCDMSTVSKHLAILREAGIIESRKEGPKIFYRLRVPCIMNFFGCIDAVNQANAERYASLQPLRGAGR